MAGFSLLTAFLTVLIVNLISAAEGIPPIILFIFFLLLNCECAAYNVSDEDQTSMLFMAVICSGLVVLLCGILASRSIHEYLCAIGLQDPETVHPVVPIITMVSVIVLYQLFLKRAANKKLLVQKLAARLMRTIDCHSFNPRLKRIRRMMIKEGTLTERLFDEED